MHTQNQIRIVPFEAVYGYRPRYEKKQEAFGYLRSLLCSSEFINDAYAIMEYRLPMHDEISQRFNMRYLNNEENIAAMSYELSIQFRNLDSETAYFILGLQAHQELDTLKKLVSEDHLTTTLQQFNADASAPCFLPEPASATLRQFIPLSLSCNVTQKGVAKLVGILNGMVNKYSIILDKITGGRLNSNNAIVQYGNNVFELFAATHKRIELTDGAMELVKEYFMLLTLDKNLKLSNEPMMKEEDVRQFISYNFMVGPRPSERTFKCSLRKTHLRYFVRRLYLKLMNKEKVNPEEFRNILLCFNCFKGANDERNLSDTFGKKPDGYSVALERLMNKVLDKWK